MATKIKDNAGFLKSMAGAILLFAFTLFGMAEMTRFQFGSSLISGASSQAAQQVRQATQRASTSASASQTSGNVAAVVDQVAETVAVGASNTAVQQSTSDYLVELSAAASNAQIPEASLNFLSDLPPPSNLGEFNISRSGDGFKIRGNGVIGVGYILEGSPNLKDWFSIARNLPITQDLEFNVQKDDRLQFAYLRVRAERVLTAASMNVADLIVADLTPSFGATTGSVSPTVPGQPSNPTVDTSVTTQPTVTGILGSSGGN